MLNTLEKLMNFPITINKESTLADVTKTMLDNKIARVLVKENEKITSIVTEKDMGLFLIKDESDRTLQQIPLSELAKPLLTVSKFARVSDCAKTMLENKIGSLGVVSEEKEIVGVITKTDLVRNFVADYQNEKIVRDYMSTNYSWIYSDASLNKVASKMAEDNVSRLIVKNKEETPVGLVSFRDLFSLVMSIGAERDWTFPKSFESEHGLGKTTLVDEVMQNEILTVSCDDDLIKTCKILLDNKINGVGVLSSNGSLIGILSKTDVIKVMASLNQY